MTIGHQANTIKIVYCIFNLHCVILSNFCTFPIFVLLFFFQFLMSSWWEICSSVQVILHYIWLRWRISFVRESLVTHYSHTHLKN